MLAKYQEALAELPKGTISEKQVKGNTYYYLKYRDGKRLFPSTLGRRKLKHLNSRLTGVIILRQ